MGAIKDQGNEVFRDFTTSGVPASGENEPEKSDIRALFGLVDDVAYASQAGLAVVADLAARDAFYADAENQPKLVYVNNNNGAGDDPENGVYEYVDGAARLAVGFYQGVAAVVDPLVEEASDAAEEAVAARDELRSTLLNKARLGAATVAGTGTSTLANTSIMNNAPSPIDGVVRTAHLQANTNAAVTFFTADDNGDGTASIVERFDTYTVAGVSSYRIDLPIAAGQITGFFGPASKSAGSGTDALYCTGLLGADQAVTAGAGFGAQFAVDIVSAEGEDAADQADLGGVYLIGRAEPAVAGSATQNIYFVANYEPAAFDGYVVEVAVAMAAVAPDSTIAVVHRNSDGTFDLVEKRKVDLLAGVNRVRPQGLAIARGDYVGIFSSTGVMYQTLAGAHAVYTTGVPANDTASNGILANYGLQLGVTIARDERAYAEQLKSGQAVGLAGDGTTEVTAEIKQLQVNGAHLPPGDYAVTELAAAGEGLWGPGRIRLNGARFFIHRAPSFSSLHHQFRAALGRQLGDRSGLALLGDSITQGTMGVSSRTKHWAYMLTKFANAFTSPGDDYTVTQFQTGAAGLGLTLPGSPSFEPTHGPNGQAMTLEDGDSITLTGAYAYIDVFYTQDAGAGSLVFAFDGSSYKTVDCSGATELDKSTWPSETGQAGSGTYTITASGGPVEITGLMRLGEEIDTFDHRLPVFNYAVNGWPMLNLNNAGVAYRITSIVKQLGVFGGAQHGALLMFGENDQIDKTPDVIYDTAVSLVGKLRAAGIKTIWGCGILRPLPGTYEEQYQPGCSYAGANAAIRGAYQDTNVPIVPLDSMEFDALGYIPATGTAAGVHPIDAGQHGFAQMLIESMARSFG